MSETTEQVSKAFVAYYKRLLGTKDQCCAIRKEVVQQGPILDAETALQLTREVTTDEKIAALDVIGKDKSPGPDGYGSLFFKKAWNIVGGFCN